jgi:hypothetical protein
MVFRLLLPVFAVSDEFVTEDPKFAQPPLSNSKLVEEITFSGITGLGFLLMSSAGE